MSHAVRISRRGWSLVGMLVALACMVVLFAISMQAMNRAVTGEGNTRSGTVRSMQDKLMLSALHQTLVAASHDHRGRYPTPRLVAGSDDVALDTSADFWSALIMHHGVRPEMLVSANEASGYVWEDDDYDHRSLDARNGVYWDETFVADLDDRSNVSFAHMPFFGDRYDDAWRAQFSGSVPLLGNRGPRDGVDDPVSRTYGRDGTWAGHFVFGDGHVAFTESFTPSGVFYESDGVRLADNVFRVDDGADGGDAVIAFTRRMTADGPELQWD